MLGKSKIFDDYDQNLINENMNELYWHFKRIDNLGLKEEIKEEIKETLYNRYDIIEEDLNSWVGDSITLRLELCYDRNHVTYVYYLDHEIATFYINNEGVLQYKEV